MNAKNKAIVIDDDRLVCRVIGKLLKERDIESLDVFNGRDAETILREEGKNLAMAIVDLVLPNGPTGWDIIDDIRNNADTCDMPVVVITGAHISSDEIKKIAKKVDMVVFKQNFDLDSFGGVLDDLLKEKKR